jgi:thiamine pyrophosphate-dependent acetolactate synthase large subunit-like protein
MRFLQRFLVVDTRTASDILVDTLELWGIDVIFGLPGDGINGIVEALRTRRDRIKFIVARHEEAAAFMACAYAKLTGRLGCCLATTGPGGVHLLNGLYDAKFDGAPVLAITGLPYHDLLQTRTQQDIDHVRLFQDVAVHTSTVTGAAQVEQATALACRVALSRRGVSHLAIPVDIQEQELQDDEPSPRNRAGATTTHAEPRVLPAESDVQAAAAVLNAGRRVAILAGQGAHEAREQLLQTADLLGAPIAKALLGKAVVPDDHPSVTGGVGYLGARPSQQVFAECDTLLIVGSSFPYIEYYPEPGRVRAVQIDRDPSRIGLRFPVESGMAGDAVETLRILNPLLERKADRRFLEQAQRWKQEWYDALEAGADRPGMPMKPQRVVRDLNARLDDDALIVTDCGQNTGLAAQYIRIREAQAFAVSGTLASMGGGLPYAIAGALAFPGRQVVAVVGDGGLSMSVAELSTCVRYQLPVKIVVINNSSLAQIKWEQLMFLGNPEYGCDLEPVDFAQVAAGFGVRGFRLDDPEKCATTLDEALSHPGPALVDAVVDSNEPMLPPKRREEFVKKLSQALERGTPGRAEIERRLREEPAVTSLRE